MQSFPTWGAPDPSWQIRHLGKYDLGPDAVRSISDIAVNSPGQFLTADLAEEAGARRASIGAWLRTVDLRAAEWCSRDLLCVGEISPPQTAISPEVTVYCDLRKRRGGPQISGILISTWTPTALRSNSPLFK